jgi:uncharacterized protein (DUF2147 family)
VALLLLAAQASAQEPLKTPADRWLTVSDVTGKVNGEVEIVEERGEFLGSLVAGAKPGALDGQTCKKCSGERRDKPMAGLIILSGIHRQGQEWGGGEILDPDTGKVYRIKLKLTESGTKLLVRGYVGVSMLGRTQEVQLLQWAAILVSKAGQIQQEQQKGNDGKRTCCHH